MDRRAFIKSACCSAVGTLGLSQAITELELMGSLAAQTLTDYKALVCIYQQGGNDGFNSVIPITSNLYDAYSRARTALTLPRNQILPIQPKSDAGVSFGLHPRLSNIQKLIDGGKGSILFNVGPLEVPTTKTDYLNDKVPLPPQLFAHDDQQAIWQSLKGLSLNSNGWGGRIADIMTSQNPANAKVQMTISVQGGGGIFCYGEKTSAFSVDPQGMIRIEGYGNAPTNGGSDEEKLRFQLMRKLLQRDNPNLLAKAYSKIQGESQQRSLELGDIINSSTVSVSFPDWSIGPQLQMVAKLIAAREQLGLKRQIFFVMDQGYDAHDNLLSDHDVLMNGFDLSIAAFVRALESLNVSNNVTTFTASEFGRTLSYNGKGTDHAWGNNHFIFGGAVKGAKLYGKYPDVTLGGPDDIGRGVFAPTVAVEEYGATLARWFGVSATDMPYVFPKLARFGSGNLGFL
jgi:uncharacterized protein (DUF1501 family)